MSRQRGVVLGRAPVGDLVDLGLRLVDDVVDLALAGVARSARSWCRRRPGGAGSPSRGRSRRSSRRWPRSARWPRGCGGRARRRCAGSSPRRCELGGDGDRVGRLAAAVEVDDRVVDRSRGRAGRSRRPRSDLGDVGDGVLGQQHRAEHALLGGDVLRRRAVARARSGASPGRVGRRTVAPVVERRLRQPSRVLLGDAHRWPLLDRLVSTPMLRAPTDAERPTVHRRRLDRRRPRPRPARAGAAGGPYAAEGRHADSALSTGACG